MMAMFPYKYEYYKEGEDDDVPHGFHIEKFHEIYDSSIFTYIWCTDEEMEE